MNCMEIRDKLLDYMEDNLEDAEKEMIELHIDGCTKCKKEYEEILEAAHYVKQGFEKISVPQGFMEGVKGKIKKSTVQGLKIRNPLKTIFIAAALTILFTITALAAGSFDFLKWFQEMSLEESKSIEELIAGGYGENVNVSVQDKNIKFTIEKVVADDTCTILSYSIEDMNKERKYMAYDLRKSSSFEGEFNYRFNYEKNPYVAHSILYCDKPYIEKGMIRLEPIKDEKSTINITINQFFYGDEMPLSSLEGSWTLSVPITKYKAKTYVLNKEVDIDGNRVVFKEIKIAPTNTTLIYSYKESQKGYSILNFNNMKLIADGKEYKNKYMGAGYSKSTNENIERSIEFDSMYLDKPNSIEIFIESYSVNVHKYKYYDIDVNKPFPQVFEYFGSKISIDEIIVGDEKTEVTMSQQFGENKYEQIDVEFGVEGHPFVHDACNLEDRIVYDKKGREIDLKDINEEELEKLQPRKYYKKQRFILEDAPGIEKLPEEYHTGKLLIPVKLKVQGYQETRYVNESFTVNLNK